MALDQKQAAQVLVQALAKAQSRGVYELHESALVHEALTLLGPKLGLVPEQVPAEVSDTQPPEA
jgi:hypothetical protein